MRQTPKDLLTELGHAAEQRLLWLGRGIFGSEDPEVVDIDRDLSRRIILGLAVLDSQRSAPILVVVNSDGGYELDGASVFDAIAQCRSHVTTLVMGSACSAAAVLTQAADLRLISPHSFSLLHHGEYDLYATRPGEGEVVLQFNRKLKKMTLGMLNSRAQLPARKLANLLKTDCWLDAEQTVELGFADKVFKGNWAELINATV